MTVGTEPLELVAAAATDVGRTRDHNEDRVLVREDLRLYLVADGAGGHRAGDVAASLALESIANYFAATEADARRGPALDKLGMATDARRLSAAIQKANRDVVEISKREQRFQGMGTTIVAARVAPRQRLLHVAHVGDSRCYRLRAGYVDQLTEDHSLINDVLEERPEIDDSVVERLPKHVVTRALGMSDRVRCSVRAHPMAPGDRYLLCSDGLTGPLGNDAVAHALLADEPPERVVAALIGLANEAGGPDNIAALVLDVRGEEEAGRVSVAAPPGPPVTDADASQPEILVLGIEEVSLGPPDDLSVVPRSPARGDLLAALGDLIGPPGIRRKKR